MHSDSLHNRGDGANAQAIALKVEAKTFAAMRPIICRRIN